MLADCTSSSGNLTYTPAPPFVRAPVADPSVYAWIRASSGNRSAITAYVREHLTVLSLDGFIIAVFQWGVWWRYCCCSWRCLMTVSAVWVRGLMALLLLGFSGVFVTALLLFQWDTLWLYCSCVSVRCSTIVVDVLVMCSMAVLLPSFSHCLNLMALLLLFRWGVWWICSYCFSKNDTWNSILLPFQWGV